MGDIVTGYNRHPAFAYPHDLGDVTFGLATPTLWEVPMVLRNRISTKTIAGAAETIPATFAYGEAIELRYTSALTTKSFNGLYLRVDTSVANANGIKGIDVDVRRSTANIACGNFMAISGIAYTGNLGADNAVIDALYGVNCEAAVDASFVGTVSLLVGCRVKVNTEDGATITASYGVYIEHEPSTGSKDVTGAIGVHSIAGAKFTALIDCSTADLAITDTDKVTLIKFKDAAGNVKSLVYDVSGGVTSVV